MKVALSLIMIHLLIFVYSIPAYADENSKTMYEKAQKLKRRLRDLEQEIILTHDEDRSDQDTEILTPHYSYDNP